MALLGIALGQSKEEAYAQAESDDLSALTNVSASSVATSLPYHEESPTPSYQ